MEDEGHSSDPRHTLMCEAVEELNASLGIGARLQTVGTWNRFEWFWEASNGKTIEWKDT